MKKSLCLFLLLAATLTTSVQSFRDIDGLKELRSQLHTEDSLMHLGILKVTSDGLKQGILNIIMQ